MSPAAPTLAPTVDDAALAAFSLGRLERLVARQLAPVAPEERVALAHATFSVFLDCRDLGLGDEAHELVEILRQPPTPAAQPAA